MKIALVRPWVSWIGQTSPPLGLAYISRALKRNGHEVRVFDARLKRESAETLARKVAAYNPALAGITVMTPEYEECIKFRSHLKYFAPQIPVMAGGPHITALPSLAIEDKACDIAVSGEGESASIEIADAIQKGSDLSGVPGCMLARDGKSEPGPPRFHEISDQYGFPDWEAVCPENYWKHSEKPLIHLNRRYIPLLTSRGCPGKCNYCSHSLGRTWRPRVPRNVIEEVRFLHSSIQVQDIHIYDDCFNLDEERSVNILEGISRTVKRPALSFPNGLMASSVTPRLGLWLKKAGCYRVCLGIETASSGLQKNSGKNLDLSSVREAAEILSGNGIPVHGFFMLGFPGEDLTDMYRTIDFARSLRLASAEFSIVLPLPGTPIAVDASSVEYRMMHTDNPFQGIMFGTTPASLGRMRNYAFRIFFASPSTMLRAACSVPPRISIISRILSAVRTRTAF